MCPYTSTVLIVARVAFLDAYPKRVSLCNRQPLTFTPDDPGAPPRIFSTVTCDSEGLVHPVAY